MLEEFRDLYQNIMHIEDKILRLMTFYTTLFIGILTAALAIISQLPTSNTAVTTQDALRLCIFLSITLFIVAGYTLQMTIELRIRKIDFITALIRIREFFINSTPEISDYVLVRHKVIGSPEYLRGGSEDWYQIVYLIFLFGLSFMITWVLAAFFLFAVLLNDPVTVLSAEFGLWSVGGIIASIIVAMSYFASLKRTTKKYDEAFEGRFGKRQYTPIKIKKEMSDE